MRKWVIIILGSLMALLLGLAVAYPLLVSDFPSLSTVDIGVDVVYVYIEPVSANSTLKGLWWNNSVVNVINDGGLPSGAVLADGQVVSYLIVLNITNYSNESVRIRDFEAIVGPQITVDTSSGGIVFAGNPAITDSRHLIDIDGGTEVWSPQSSKLIALSGVVGVHETPYASLNNSLVYLYGYAEGQAYANAGRSAEGYSLEHVKLQSAGDGFLYNSLLNENQILLFYRQYEVSVATRR